MNGALKNFPSALVLLGGGPGAFCTSLPTREEEWGKSAGFPLHSEPQDPG